jgi:hypothetical protein
MRPSSAYTEDIMHEILEVTHACGMVAGVSDPVWKQLSDVGCCCGIPPDDPVFGNWEQENMTNSIVKARDGKNKKIFLKDITPPWAYDVTKQGICAPRGNGPTAMYRNKHEMWADFLRTNWNNPSLQRSPMNYLQGAVKIAGTDAEGNHIYEYVGLKRKNETK